MSQKIPTELVVSYSYSTFYNNETIAWIYAACCGLLPGIEPNNDIAKIIYHNKNQKSSKK